MADMQTNPLVTIVVPIYNVERYLDTCVESIVNQPTVILRFCW